MSIDAEETPQILIVDDEPDIRAMLIANLEPLGVNVVEADNGRQALAVLKSKPIDVVVSDLVMPQMSGLMLLHSCLEQAIYVPFILISGYGDKDSAIQALRLGAYDFLEKPVDIMDMQAVVSEAIKMSRQQRVVMQALESVQEPNGLLPIDRTASFQIMKMRTLRGSQEGPVAPPPGTSNSFFDLKELFITEATSQLIFSESATRDLHKKDATGSNVALILRLVQSVRLAAETIRLGDIVAFCWSLETLLSEYRRRPKTPNQVDIKLLLEAHEVLRQKLAVLADPTAKRVLAQLQDASDQETKKAS